MGNPKPNRERSDRVTFAYLHSGAFKGLCFEHDERILRMDRMGGSEHDEGILRMDRMGNPYPNRERSDRVSSASQKAL